VKAATRTSGRPRRGARDRCPWGSTSATSPARSPDGGVALAGGGRPGSTRPPRPATGRAVTVGNGAAIPRGRAAGRPRTRHPADSCTEAPDPIGGGGFHRETFRCRPSVNRPSGVSPGRRRKAGWPAGTPIREARAHRPRSAPAGGRPRGPGTAHHAREPGKGYCGSRSCCSIRSSVTSVSSFASGAEAGRRSSAITRTSSSSTPGVSLGSRSWVWSATTTGSSAWV